MKFLLKLLIPCFVLAACTPEPLTIRIDQAPEQLAISSATPDAGTVIVAVSYSITSVANLSGAGASTGTSIPPGLLVDNASVILTDGSTSLLLSQVLPGIYWNTSANFISGHTYTISVKDNAKGNAVTASSVYKVANVPAQMLPVVTRHPNDTTVVLNMTIADDMPGMDYYVMAYDRINPSSVPSTVGSPAFSLMNTDAIKKVEVFSDADAVNHVISKSFKITGISGSDTLFVHYGKIDKGYYDYLSSYKRGGSLISQIISEPVTLPTNIIKGLGYFAVYDAQRTFYDLKNY